MRSLVLVFAGALASGCAFDFDNNIVPGSATRVQAGGMETGRLTGITKAHNMVRASVNASKPLPDLEWSEDLAQVAQSYAEHLGATCELVHSHGAYGENLALFGGQRATADTVVGLWADEGQCWTYGAFMKSDACSASCDACGHYTQIVWRNTKLVGCGVADCQGGGQREIWVCNYDPPGNVITQNPY